jgi:SAM-dependent methyltransferase
MPSKPPIDPRGDAHFRTLVRELGLDPDNPWLGGYVDYEWTHGRHIYETYDEHLAGRRYLEFGCNYGATSIVLAALGAHVTGADVDRRALQIARANAGRHGMCDTIDFVLVAPRPELPFASASFDRVVCNSVLEYLPAESLASYQRELDRVLRPGGLLFVSGTSSRLAPREVHSGRWLVNYLPRWMDTMLTRRDKPLERGVSPWQVRHGFGQYENVDWSDGGRAYLASRAKITSGSRHLQARKLAHRAARLLGVSLGLLTPSLAVVLRKPGLPAEAR